MTVREPIIKNGYLAWMDGYCTAQQALRSLCADYEELDKAYNDYKGMREQTRVQMSNVVGKLDGRASVQGFGTLTIGPATVTEGYDKQMIRDLIYDLLNEHPDIASRLAACSTQSMRAGGLRIEREKK